MGLFDRIKRMIEYKKFQKELKRSIQNAITNEKRYVQMTSDELSNLSDDELFVAVSARTENKVSSFAELQTGLDSLNCSQRIFYALNWLEMEVNNGGLCQFFVNSSRTVAPFVSEYMGIIGATDHQKLFDGFVADNGIDLNDLSSFIIYDADEFEQQNARYPFEEYDRTFYDMAPLEVFLKKFVRENVTDF